MGQLHADQTAAIVGYGTAAVNAVIALRTSGYQGKIQVFSDAGARPYSPMMTASYAAGTCDYEGMFPWDACDLQQLDAEIVAGATVVELDADTHTLVVERRVEGAAGGAGAGGAASMAGARGASDGVAACRAGNAGVNEGGGALAGRSSDESAVEGGVKSCAYSYDVCLIATGAHPVRQQMQGTNPLVLRTLRDAELLKNTLTSKNTKYDSLRVLVSGASMVALKAVDACLSRGVPVTLLCRGEHLMGRTACEEIASALEESLAEKGVRVRLSQVIAKTEALENGATRVTFSNGDVADYSNIVVAHGIAPNTDFVAKGASSHSPARLASARPKSERSASAHLALACSEAEHAAAGRRVAETPAPEHPASETPARKRSICQEENAADVASIVGEGIEKGLMVDEFMRTQLPDVYAAGDVARVLNLSTGAHQVAGLWKEACLQGATAGYAMAAVLAGETPSNDHCYRGFIPSNCIAVGGSVVLSAGSIASAPDRWREVAERNDCLIVAVYERGLAEEDSTERGSDLLCSNVRGSSERDAREQSSSAQSPNECGSGVQNLNVRSSDERNPHGKNLGKENPCEKERRLVGYNVFSMNADPATSFAYDEAAMLYRCLVARRGCDKGSCNE